jgi:putative endonuclease
VWYLYLIECTNGALYAGITTDVAARYAKHASGKGAKYTRANPPVRLIGSITFEDRSSASKAEYKIKQLPRAEKIVFLLAG